MSGQATANMGEASGEQHPPIRFTVVSAVYNVAKYIDDFIGSLIAQTLPFDRHIELVLVDDGSTDNSAKIIRKWQKKFPANIQCVTRPNGGPAAARNTGLALASGEWVTFIDPDDFVAEDYFARVDETIRSDHGGELGLVSCALIFFEEAARLRHDTHPLRYRFANGLKVGPLADLGRFVQLNVTSAFFRRDIIDAAGLRFDERVRPVFEDADFACRFTLHAGDALAVFLPEAKYFYRRRADGSSLLQSASDKPEMYADKVRFGYLGALTEAQRICGHVPRHVQLTVLYSLSWDLQRLVDGVGPMPQLTPDQATAYIALLREVFTFIDDETIAGYDVHAVPEGLAVGLLHFFKNRPPSTPAVEAVSYDRTAGQICMVHRSGSEAMDVRYSVDGSETPAAFSKVRRSDLLGRTFLWEHIAWVDAPLRSLISVTAGGVPATIVARRRGQGQQAEVSTLVAALAPRVPPEPRMPPETRQLRMAARSPQARTSFTDAWLFMDRDSVADDSAEFFYRYVREQRADINAWFILRRDSPDWKRLAADRFRLIAFSEPAHAIALMNAKYLISSQADHYVTGYLNDRNYADRLKYRFVFLQHGVSRDDISGWLNGIGIDLMITSTGHEHRSIVADRSPYRFTRKECVLTGLPRHDALLAAVGDEKPTIVIMPTWRSALTGPALGPGNARAAIPAFHQSEFARRWKGLLRSARLREIADAAGHSITFVPHPNMEQYLRFFDVPKSIRVRRFGDGRSMQGLFQSMAAFVTDYSSKAFDAAYVGAPVVYYQFDRDAFFNGLHISRPGYFDCEADGFGPVCTEEGDTLRALEAQLQRGEPEPVYRGRAESTFPFRDGKCSERVLDAILAIDSAQQPPATVAADGDAA